MKILKIISFLIIVSSLNGQNHMSSISEDIVRKYIDDLNHIRSNPELLKNFAYNDEEPKHLERSRINIALFNDFKNFDYQIAKYLFAQESIWRSSQNYYETGEVDNLYFSALLISRYKQAEMVIPFFQVKMIDFDSGIGFDGEFLLSNGKQETYEYLIRSESKIKSEIYKHIGASVSNCEYKDEDFQIWLNSKYEYFRNYILPIDDEMWFLYSTKEGNILESNFDKWVKENEEWNLDNIWKYITFAKYLDKSDHHLIALEKQIELQNKPIDEQHWRYNGLIKAYFEYNKPNESLILIESILNVIEGKNRRREYVEIMCDFIISNKHIQTHERLLKLINIEVSEYGSFSKNIDDKLSIINRRNE